MKLDTLIYIKRLLEADVSSKNEDLREVRKELWEKEKQIHLSKYDLEELRNEIALKRERLLQSETTLDDFMGKEWS